MDHTLELKYFLEKIVDYVHGLEGVSGEIALTDDNRVLFRFRGRPFEILPWVDADNDLICVTTRTADQEAARFEDAVNTLQATLQICWDHCVSVMAAERRYDLSMALFLGGFSFEAFEGVVFNLVACAEAVEEN